MLLHPQCLPLGIMNKNYVQMLKKDEKYQNSIYFNGLCKLDQIFIRKFSPILSLNFFYLCVYSSIYMNYMYIHETRRRE